jgi:hypothetical protein
MDPTYHSGDKLLDVALEEHEVQSVTDRMLHCPPEVYFYILDTVSTKLFKYASTKLVNSLQAYSTQTSATFKVPLNLFTLFVSIMHLLETCVE